MDNNVQSRLVSKNQDQPHLALWCAVRIRLVSVLPFLVMLSIIDDVG